MKIINLVIYSTISLILVFSLASCGHKHNHEDGHDHNHDHGDEMEEHSQNDGHGHGYGHAEGEIFLTKDQIETMDIQFGTFSQVKLNDYVKATGKLDLPSNAYASVSTRVGGHIKSTKKFVEGDYIKKGATIGYLENQEIISFQQKYLEVSAELTFLQQELSRQRKLLDANAGIEKNVQRLQSEVNMKSATLSGLSKKLNYLGINSENLTIDNIRDRITIVSPKSGYITSVNIHDGSYVSPETELMEIVNESHVHLELDVFEKDIVNIKAGQKLSYSLPALGSKVYEGEVDVIGREFNKENKTVRVHGHVNTDRPKFIKDLFVEAKIWLNDQTVEALPEKAIIKDGTSTYIYAANNQNGEDELKFEPIMVIEGINDKGYTSVKLIDKIPNGMEIVTKGAYYVFAQSKAGELKHEH
ncbi:MAG: efflux RND transporter periplasmic adaptor subunit [Bacteroidia bacterium]|nr:efflux RND transporter periplasmic adaptor subunit [Bacteroidia bacterium]